MYIKDWAMTITIKGAAGTQNQPGGDSCSQTLAITGKSCDRDELGGVVAAALDRQMKLLGGHENLDKKVEKLEAENAKLMSKLSLIKEAHEAPSAAPQDVAVPPVIDRPKRTRARK
jgi:hypothetical protein